MRAMKEKQQAAAVAATTAVLYVSVPISLLLSHVDSAAAVAAAAT